MGVWDFTLGVGSRLVSGKYHEPEEPCGVSKRENPPCFWRHFFARKLCGALSPVIFKAQCLNRTVYSALFKLLKGEGSAIWQIVKQLRY